MMTRFFVLVSILLLAAGCAVNPVTGKRDLVMVSEQWELDVGAQQYAPLRQAQGGDFTLDPALVNYVQGVGQRLAAVSDRQLPYEFNVINDSVPNAWALPGGKISINRGLLTEMDSESELAAVLGHEIVHSAARHGAQGQSRSILLQGAVLAGGIAAGMATDDQRYASAALLGGMIGAQLVNQRYSRDAERESDLYGMRYMQRAGYNPRGAVELQETFLRLSEGRRQDMFSALFASHPPSRERVDNNRQLLAELGDSGEIGRDRYQQAIAGLNAPSQPTRLTIKGARRSAMAMPPRPCSWRSGPSRSRPARRCSTRSRATCWLGARTTRVPNAPTPKPFVATPAGSTTISSVASATPSWVGMPPPGQTCRPASSEFRLRSRTTPSASSNGAPATATVQSRTSRSPPNPTHP